MAYMTLAQAESIAATLVARGYTARSYPARPSGHRVLVTGRDGRGGFTYQITDPDPAALQRALDDLSTGNLDAAPPDPEGTINTTNG